jgi:hypothetical protein
MKIAKQARHQWMQGCRCSEATDEVTFCARADPSCATGRAIGRGKQAACVFQQHRACRRQCYAFWQSIKKAGI